MRNTVQCQ
jgi:hypothetical protein